MAIAILEVDYVSICQLAPVIGRELQTEHSFPYDRTESRVKKSLEKNRETKRRQYSSRVSTSTLFLMVCLPQRIEIEIAVTVTILRICNLSDVDNYVRYQNDFFVCDESKGACTPPPPGSAHVSQYWQSPI